MSAVEDVAELERLKMEAVEAEEYELAATLKKQIAALKAGAEQTPNKPQNEAAGAAPEAAPVAAPVAAADGPNGSAAHPDFPDLPFEGYLNCPLFAKINTEFPGLQLIHERPYIFLVLLPPSAL